MKTEKTERVRIHLIDEIRGFCVFCMLFYHAFYLAAFEFEWSFGAELLEFFMPAEPIFAGIFVMISGISAQLTRSNLRRGGRLLLISLGVTLVTCIVLPEESILFGILHLLSVCMLLFGLCGKALDRIPASALITACIGLTLFTAGMWTDTYFGIPGVPALQIPTQTRVPWLFPLGIRTADFFSSDYFPLLPWGFVFLFGTVLGRWVRAGKYPACFTKMHLPFFAFFGRHALIFYLVHQPAFFVLFWCIRVIFSV